MSEEQAFLLRSALPVHAEAYEGLGDVQGMLSFDGQQLRLSFQTADALFGVLKSKARELVLPLEQLEQVDYGLGWFWMLPWVELELNDFSALAQWPSARHGRVRLRVRFADRHRARRFVDQLRHARAAHLHARLQQSLPAQLEQLEQLEQPAQALPTVAPSSGADTAAAVQEPAAGRTRLEERE